MDRKAIADRLEFCTNQIAGCNSSNAMKLKQPLIELCKIVAELLPLANDNGHANPITDVQRQLNHAKQETS